jgi:hypothetical protein
LETSIQHTDRLTLAACYGRLESYDKLMNKMTNQSKEIIMTGYQTLRGKNKEVITALIDGNAHVADSDHPYFEKIREHLINDEPERAVKLFDIGTAITDKFKRLSERWSVRDGKILFDNEEVHTVLSEQILAFVNEGVENWKPLVLFGEKLESNPRVESRAALYAWLSKGKFTITAEGDVIGYKGVSMADGKPMSTKSGKAFVDGVEVNGLVEYQPGSIVEMPRGEVSYDASASCAVGLHVGTYSFASTFVSGGKTLAVLVNPRDVVSVPTHENDKMRVCRLKVLDYVDKPYTDAFVDINPNTVKADARVFDADGYDQDGFDEKGFNDEGLDKDGFDMHGWNEAGYSRSDYDENGDLI